MNPVENSHIQSPLFRLIQGGHGLSEDGIAVLVSRVPIVANVQVILSSGRKVDYFQVDYWKDPRLLYDHEKEAQETALRLEEGLVTRFTQMRRPNPDIDTRVEPVSGGFVSKVRLSPHGTGLVYIYDQVCRHLLSLQYEGDQPA